MAAHPAWAARTRRADSARNPSPPNLIILPQEDRLRVPRRRWPSRSPGNIIPFSRRPRLRPGDLAIMYRSGDNDGALVRIRQWVDPRSLATGSDMWIVDAVHRPLHYGGRSFGDALVVSGARLRRVSSSRAPAQEMGHV